MVILVIDKDENTYKRLLQALPNFVSQTIALDKQTSLPAAERWLAVNPQPDLIISEIDFEEALIFDLYKELKLRCPIILTSMAKDYAMEAFQMNTVDYLLKPLTDKILSKSLKKFFIMKQTFSIDKNANTYKDRFYVSMGNKILYVIQSEISFFLSEDKVVYIYTNDGRRYIVDNTLDALQLKIDPQLYFRINRQVLLQLDSIVAIKKYDNRRLLITLNYGEIKLDFIVSRNRVKEFKKWVGK